MDCGEREISKSGRVFGACNRERSGDMQSARDHGWLCGTMQKRNANRKKGRSTKSVAHEIRTTKTRTRKLCVGESKQSTEKGRISTYADHFGCKCIYNHRKSSEAKRAKSEGKELPPKAKKKEKKEEKPRHESPEIVPIESDLESDAE